MGSLAEKKLILQQVFQKYDTTMKGELTPHQLQNLHGEIRLGGISIPQVNASIAYACATDACFPEELYDVLQEMDRRFFLVQDFRWEFSLLDREQKDTISEEQARWMLQAVHGKYFSKRKWNDFLRRRLIPGSRVSFAEIEVILCNIPDRTELERERLEEEREKEDKIRRQKELEEAAEKEKERLKRQREEMRLIRDEEKKKEEERKKREEDEKRQREEEERLRELEEKRREEERRRKEDEEKYKDVEKIAEESRMKERESEEELKRLEKLKQEAEDLKSKQDVEEKEKEAKKTHKEHKHRRIRYDLKVALKQRDRFKLEYTLKEFDKEKVKDIDIDFDKAKKMLKELLARDDLKKAMSKRELEELEKVMEYVRSRGYEGQLASEMLEANKLLIKLRRLERIRHEILELKQSTVAEIRSYQSPPAAVYTVMTATFLILGHKEKETKEWKAIQALVGKIGKDSLKRRCVECDTSKIDVTAARRAKELLGKYELDAVRDVSAGAATFYVWATSMVEEVLDPLDEENAE